MLSKTDRLQKKKIYDSSGTRFPGAIASETGSRMIDGTSALEEKDQDLGLKKTDLQCCKVRKYTKDKGWGRPQATRMHLIPPTCALKAVETVCFHHIGRRAGAEAQWVECFPSACKALG